MVDIVSLWWRERYSRLIKWTRRRIKKNTYTVGSTHWCWMVNKNEIDIYLDPRRKTPHAHTHTRTEKKTAIKWKALENCLRRCCLVTHRVHIQSSLVALSPFNSMLIYVEFDINIQCEMNRDDKLRKSSQNWSAILHLLEKRQYWEKKEYTRTFCSYSYFSDFIDIDNTLNKYIFGAEPLNESRSNVHNKWKDLLEGAIFVVRIFFSRIDWLLLLLLQSWAKLTFTLLSWKFNFNSAKMWRRCFHYSLRERVDSEWWRAVRIRSDFWPGSGSERVGLLFFSRTLHITIIH